MCSRAAAADSATAGPSSAGPSGSVGPTQDVTAGTTDVSDDVCWWDLLHESLREAVLSHLSTRDLARVAWTCRYVVCVCVCVSVCVCVCERERERLCVWVCRCRCRCVFVGAHGVFVGALSVWS